MDLKLKTNQFLDLSVDEFKMQHIFFAIFIVSVSSIDTEIKHTYTSFSDCRISDCHFSNVTETISVYVDIGKCLTFVCVPNFQLNETSNVTSIKCSETENEVLPKESAIITNKIIQINFENCSMSSLSTSIFEEYDDIHILNVSYLGLNILNDQLFNVTHIVDLDASHNNITEVSSFLFVNAKKIIKVNFSFNQIDRIDSVVFDGNSQVEVLNFAYNNISSLPKEFFDHFPELKRLNLSHNAIKSFEDYMFYNLKKLTTLDLSHTMLTTIKSATFFYQTQPLKYLDLSDNLLKVLDIGIFDSAISFPSFIFLERLMIGGNQLYEMNGFSTFRLPHVRIDGLDQNKFNCSYFKVLLSSFHLTQIKLSSENNTNHLNALISDGFQCTAYNEPTTIGRKIFICVSILGFICFTIIMLFKHKKNLPRTVSVKNVHEYYISTLGSPANADDSS